jgi:hypothetical protein
MSTMIPNTLRALANLEHGFTMWLHRISRRELRNLSDRDCVISVCHGAKRIWELPSRSGWPRLS